MEGQTRPSVMGFSSMYFRSANRIDRASLVDGFKQIKDRGVRYEDIFPGSYDPGARGGGDPRGQDRRRGHLQRGRTVWNGIKLCQDKELAWPASRSTTTGSPVPGVRTERFVCNGTLPTTGIDDASRSCTGVSRWDCDRPTRVLPEWLVHRPSSEDDRFWAAAVELGMPNNVHTQFFFPAGDLGSKVTAEG